MIKKITQAAVWKFLLLEIHIRGIRIKSTAWRQRLAEWLFAYKADSPKLFMHRQKKTGHLNMPKVASTSIKLSLFDSDCAKNHYMNPKKGPGIDKEKTAKTYIQKFYLKEITYNQKWVILEINAQEEVYEKQTSLDEINAHFIFTFVRNPFTKFVSFFQNKYKYRDDDYYFDQIHLWPIRKIASFDELVGKISKLPDCYLERHTLPQYYPVKFFANLGVKIDFIGKFEKLEEEFEPIRQRFNLAPLEYANKSMGEKQDWRDYYTAKTAKLIYQRYRQDFEMFGYEEEYPKLLNYLAAKTKQD